MMKVLDIYGTLFNFSIDRNLKFKTNFGGFLTLFTLGICFIITFLFGRDFYYRTNPKVLNQEIISERFEKKLVTNENITIAWRIEDKFGNKIEFENLLYPRMQYLYYYLNETNTRSELGKNFDLPIKRCSNLVQELEASFHLELNATEWFCFDFSEFEADFGGYWNTEFLYYYTLSFQTCPPEYNFLEESEPANNTFAYIDPMKTCTSKASLDKFIGQEVYLSIMFPKKIFAFNNIDNPVQTNWYNFFRRLDTELLRYETCEFDTAILEDDKGWIFREEHNSTALNFLECDLSLTYTDASAYSDNVEIYLMEFYLTKSLRFAKRNFMKIQELAAITGGFVNLITIIFGLISLLINEFERDRLFVDYIFKYNRDQDDKILDDFNQKFYYEKFRVKSQSVGNGDESALDPNGKKVKNALGLLKIKNNGRRTFLSYYSNKEENYLEKESKNTYFISSPDEIGKKSNRKNHRTESSNNDNCNNDINNDYQKNDVFTKTKKIQIKTKKFDGENSENKNYKNDVTDKVSDGKKVNFELELLDKHKRKRIDKLDKNKDIKDNKENSHDSTLFKKDELKSNIEDRETSKDIPYVNQNKKQSSSTRVKKLFNPMLQYKFDVSKFNGSMKIGSVVDGKNANFKSQEFEDKSMLVINNSSNRHLMELNRSQTENNLDAINPKNISNRNHKNNEYQTKLNKELKSSKTSNEFFSFTKDKETHKEYIKENSNGIDLQEILQKSRNHYSNFTFLEFVCFKFCRNPHIQSKNTLYTSFNLGRSGLLGKLDLIKYLKNLLLIKIMSKLLLNKEQKFYMKNYYKSFIDIGKKLDKIKMKEIEKEQIRSENLNYYLHEVLKRDEDDISQVDHLIFRNIFNIHHT